MANKEDNFEDMYAADRQDENNDASSSYVHDMSRGIKRRGMSSLFGKMKGTLASKLGSTALKKALLAMLPYIATLIGVFLIIIMLICAIVYMFSGPDILRGQIGKMVDQLFSAIPTALIGEDYSSITEQHVLDVANYIQNMGYDLVEYGFVDDTEVQLLEKDPKTGEITKVSSSLLNEYLASENRTYMLSSISVKSLYKGAMAWFNGKKNPSVSSGMINVSNNIDAVTEIVIDGQTIEYDKVAVGESNGSGYLPVELNRTVEVDRGTRKLIIKIKAKRLVNNEVKETETTCTYNLEGWVGRFGKPVEFLLALHLGTMAPRFAETIATDSDFDTKVNIRLFKSVEVVKLKYEGMTLDEATKYVNERIKAWWEFFQQQNAMAKKTLYTYQDAVNRGQEAAGVTLQEIADAKKYEQENTKEKYTPYIQSVTNHWYKDLIFKDEKNASDEDAYIKTTPVPKQSRYNKFDVFTYSSGEIYQVAEPKKSDINEAFDRLFSNTEWLKVDGKNPIPAVESDLLHGNLRSKIDVEGLDMQIVMVMLDKAQQKSDDAKYIVRDLKEYLETKGFKFKDSQILTPNGKIVDTSTGKTPSGVNPDNIHTNKINGLLGGKSANILYGDNTATVKTSEMPEGTKVQSIVGGKIQNISENAVQIEITSPSTLKGKTLIISGVNMDSGLSKGMTVQQNTPIATTVANKDIVIKMQDETKNLISVKDNL